MKKIFWTSCDENQEKPRAAITQTNHALLTVEGLGFRVDGEGQDRRLARGNSVQGPEERHCDSQQGCCGGNGFVTGHMLELRHRQNTSTTLEAYSSLDPNPKP